MASKDKLASMLGADQTIRRGRGVQLSTDATPQAVEQTTETVTAQKSESAKTHSREKAISHKSETAQSHKRRNAIVRSDEPKRVNRGYMLREDLIKEFKLIAVKEDRNFYEVMEEAMEQFLKRRKP